MLSVLIIIGRNHSYQNFNSDFLMMLCVWQDRAAQCTLTSCPFVHFSSLLFEDHHFCCLVVFNNSGQHLYMLLAKDTPTWQEGNEDLKDKKRVFCVREKAHLSNGVPTRLKFSEPVNRTCQQQQKKTTTNNFLRTGLTTPQNSHSVTVMLLWNPISDSDMLLWNPISDSDMLYGTQSVTVLCCYMEPNQWQWYVAMEPNQSKWNNMYSLRKKRLLIVFGAVIMPQPQHCSFEILSTSVCMIRDTLLRTW